MIKNKTRQRPEAADRTESVMIERILNHQSAKEQERLLYEPLWREAMGIFKPRRSDIGVDHRQYRGDKKGTEIYDGSPRNAHKIWKNGMMSGMVCETDRWFVKSIIEREFHGDDEINEWMQECERLLYAAFQRSNYYEVLPTAFDDGGSIGNSMMYRDYDYFLKKAKWAAFHPNECWFTFDMFSEMMDASRKFKLSARETVTKFDDDLPANSTLREDAKKQNKELTILHACYDRKDPIIAEFADQLPEGEWLEFYIVIDSIIANKRQGRIMSIRGDDTKRFNIWRVETVTGESYGYGPGTNSIVDALKLQKIGQKGLMRLDREIDGPLMVPKVFKGTRLDLRPHGKNYYDNYDKDKIEPIFKDFRMQAGIEREEYFRKIVEQHFSVDLFLLYMRMENRPSNVTAYEMMKMDAKAASLLSTEVGSVKNGLLRPHVEGLFYDEMKAGNLPDPPQQLLDAKQANTAVEFIGKLSQIQAKMSKLEPIYEGLEIAGSIAKTFGRQVLDKIDEDELTEYALESVKFPQKSIRGQELVLQIRERRAKDEQAAAALEIAERAAKAVPPGKQIEANSPLELAGMTGKE